MKEVERSRDKFTALGVAACKVLCTKQVSAIVFSFAVVSVALCETAEWHACACVCARAWPLRTAPRARWLGVLSPPMRSREAAYRTVPDRAYRRSQGRSVCADYRG